jgi:Hint domain
MTVTFTYTINGSSDPLILTDLEQAAADWSQYLNSNATIRVQVDVGSFPNNAGFIVQTNASDFVSLGTSSGGRQLQETWGEYALTTGSSVPGSPYDIEIIYNPASATLGGGGMYENPDPAAGGPVPSTDYDLTTMFRKALAYGLGWDAMTTTSATRALAYATPLDSYISYTGIIAGYSLNIDWIDYMQIGGPQVEAVNGGPVALVTPEVNYTEADWAHIGNSPSLSGSTDMMAVTQNLIGESIGISRLDLAIMQEAGVPIIECFARGTRIATEHGETAVERLRVGDLVRTESGCLQRIAWIGRRTVDCRRHPTPAQVQPIRVAPHAFGHGRPRRAVLLSPDHAVFVDGMLIPVRLLVNDMTIVPMSITAITYYHVELGQHDVLLANGLPVESYLDVGHRDAFVSTDIVQLHPRFGRSDGASVWDGLGYAPLIRGGERLARLRVQLASQARMLTEGGGSAGHHVTLRYARVI